MSEPAAPSRPSWVAKPLAFSAGELWGLAGLLSLLFVWTMAPLAGYDFWYYLAVGRSIAQTGEIPFTETYLGTTSTLAFGKHADAAWLGFLVCYEVYRLGGYVALTLFKSGLLVATTAVVYGNCRLLGLAPFWAGAWSTLALWTIRGRFEMRTYLFTDLCLSLLVTILILAERDAKPRRTALSLALLFVLWSNLHQGVLAGFVVMGCWMLFGRRPWKERLGLTALSFGGSMIKPYPLDFPAYVYDHFANSRAIGGVVEWAAPGRDILIYQLGPFYLGLAAIAVFGGLHLWRQRCTPPWAFGLTALFFALLAARSIRSVSELLPIVCPLAAAYCPPLPVNRRARGLTVVLMAGLLLGTFRSGNLYDLNRATGYPEALLDALPPHHGQVFNSFEFGNYMVFRGVPPFIHGITSLFQEQLIHDFEAVLNPTPQRAEILEKFQVGAALLHFPTEQDATLNFVDTLAESPDWKLELWDDTGLLFVRGKREEGLTAVYPWRSPSWTDPAAAEKELTELVKRRPSAMACRMLSELTLKRGDLPQATTLASQAVELAPYFYPGWAQLGLCYAKAGNLEGVLRASEGGVMASPDLGPARFNRALALLELAKTETGLSAFWHRRQAAYQARRALWSNPSFAPARQLLDVL